jgi:hypothetical protein
MRKGVSEICDGGKQLKSDSAMFVYSVYMLTITSDSRFPELAGRELPPREALPDVEIVLQRRRGMRANSSEFTQRTKLPGGTPWLDCAKLDEGYLLRYADYADFMVSRDGSRIECCYSSRGVSMTTIRHLLLDQVFPLVLNLRGREAIHATAIVTGRGACAFTGPAGAGKSTLAASFMLTGFMTLGDDCLGLIDDDGIRAIPAYPGVRLWSDAASALKADGHVTAAVSDYTSKSRMLASFKIENFPSEAQPLARIFKIVRPQPGEPALAAPVIEPLSPTQAFIQLISSTFPLDLTDSTMLARHFRFLQKVAAHVPFKRLRIPNNHAALAAVRELILADLERG